MHKSTCPIKNAVFWVKFVSVREVGRLACASWRLKSLFEGLAWRGVDAERDVSLETRSTSPLIVIGLEFLSRAECRGLVALGRLAMAAPSARWTQNKAYAMLSSRSPWLPTWSRRLVRGVEERVALLTGVQGAEIQLHFTPAGEPVPNTWPCESLHVDCNNGFPHRFVTALVYCNHVRGSGATCFPCARGGPVAEARRILASGSYHTTPALRQNEDEPLFDAACELLETASTLCLVDDDDAQPGLRIKPTTGTLCLFWSLDDDAQVDPASFHGGASVVLGGGENSSSSSSKRSQWDCGKWTMQIFDELPARLHDAPQAERAAFVSASRRRAGGLLRVSKIQSTDYYVTTAVKRGGSS